MPVLYSEECLQCVRQWWHEKRRASGVPLPVPPSSLLLRNTFMTGWVALLQDLTSVEIWTEEELNLHVNILEMKAVQLALNVFRDWIMGESVVLMSNSATMMAYIKKLGTVSRVMCNLAQEILTWAEQFATWYILAKKNIIANQFSHLDQVLPTNWSLLPWLFNAVCREYGHPLINLLATRANAKVPLYVSPILDPFQNSLDDLNTYASLPFTLLRQILSRVLILVAPFWP